MSTQDYSARDKAVRHNIYASVRRRDGLPHELFATYWRDVHSTLCSRLPGLGFYVQQHFDRDHTANLWPTAEGVRPIRAVLDGSAELGFANAKDQATFADAGTILYGDEANFIGEAVAYDLPNGSQTYVDREEDGARNGPDRYHRVHVYVNRKPGTGSSAWLAETSAELARFESVQKWKLHLPEPYSNDRPAPPSPNVEHLVGDDRLNLAIAEVAFASARAAREFFATPAFQKVLREAGSAHRCSRSLSGKGLLHFCTRRASNNRWAARKSSGRVDRGHRCRKPARTECRIHVHPRIDA